jgi:hypothetical protein
VGFPLVEELAQRASLNRLGISGFSLVEKGILGSVSVGGRGWRGGMSISELPVEHPLLAAVRVIEEALDDTGHLDPVYLSVAQKKELLVG